MSETVNRESNLMKNLIVISCTLIVTVISIGGILIACGSVVSDIDQNKTNIGRHDALLEIHGKEIVQGKLNDQKQAALSTNTLNMLSSVNTRLEAVMQGMNTQSMDIALIKQKMKIESEGQK